MSFSFLGCVLGKGCCLLAMYRGIYYVEVCEDKRYVFVDR